MNLPFHDAPGPEPLLGMPRIGRIPRIVAFVRDPIGTAGRLFARYGRMAAIVRAPVRLVSAVGRGVVVATGADINREVLTGHERYHMYALSGVHYPDEARFAKLDAEKAERLKPLSRMGTGLFHVNGEEHRRHRRLLMPAFHKTHIETYRDDMVRLTHRMLETWRDDQKRDIWSDMTELTLAVATTTLFGEDVGQRGLGLSRTMQAWLEKLFSMPILVRRDLPFTAYRRWLDLTKTFDEGILEILAHKRRRVAHEPGRDMLSLLLSARDEDGSRLNEDDLVGHAGVIFAAGHETSTNALTWTLLLLASHPSVAAELCEELASVLRGDAPTVEDLTKLPLLDAVVKESLRLLPPVPFYVRLVAEDHELGGYFLPRHTELMLSIFHMHRDPDVFAMPRRFLPSRWSTIKPSTFEYHPFSAGPRMCIGAAFASMEIKIVLAILLQRWRPELLPGARVDRRVAITMAPKNGLVMRVRRADQRWHAAPRSFRGNLRELVDLTE